MSPRGSRSFANVTSLLALIVVLSGTAYAAVTITGADIKNGTVTSADIKNNTVRGADILAEAVNSDDIQNGSITREDFHANATAGLTGPKGDTGARGADGAKGDTGATGAKGDTGPAGPKGEPGTSGTGGTSGASVVARARSTAPVTPTTFATQTPIPLSGATWTQAADEIDEYHGVVSVTVPASCEFDDGGLVSGGATLRIFRSVNGGAPQEITRRDFLNGITATDLRVPFLVPEHFEPGATQSATFSATFSDQCEVGHHATLHSLRLDTVGIR